MAYNGIVSINDVNNELNGAQFDVKRVLKQDQQEINKLISDLGDPNTDFITIDGQTINKKTELTRLSLAVSNKMDELQNSSSTIIGVFSTLFQMEKTLTGS